MASRTFCSTGDSALSDVVARSVARIKNRSIDIFNENTGETPDSQGLVDNKCAHRVDLDLENAYYGVPFPVLNCAERLTLDKGVAVP